MIEVKNLIQIIYIYKKKNVISMITYIYNHCIFFFTYIYIYCLINNFSMNLYSPVNYLFLIGIKLVIKTDKKKINK